MSEVFLFGIQSALEALYEDDPETRHEAFYTLFEAPEADVLEAFNGHGEYANRSERLIIVPAQYLTYMGLIEAKHPLADFD